MLLLLLLLVNNKMRMLKLTNMRLWWSITKLNMLLLLLKGKMVFSNSRGLRKRLIWSRIKMDLWERSNPSFSPR
ncbi:hypothetical protein HanPI659440_Chr01g0006501 [Helianthus annuus]|nr:hypothetical protein HanPI659440_Chr01g0006501 [Helianthus annuus]